MSQETIRQRSALPLPGHLPATGDLLAGTDGTFWVSRADQIAPVEFELAMSWRWWSTTDFATESSWDVYDPDGLLIGTVELPVQFTPMAVRDLQVTGVIVGEFDVQQVVTYEVRPS